MRIVGGHGIGALITALEPAVAEAILAWYAEVADASWSAVPTLLRRYPLAAIGSGGRVIFDLRQAGFCVVARVNFAMQIVLVEFIGPRSAAGDLSASNQAKAARK